MADEGAKVVNKPSAGTAVVRRDPDEERRRTKQGPVRERAPRPAGRASGGGLPSFSLAVGRGASALDADDDREPEAVAAPAPPPEPVAAPVPAPAPAPTPAPAPAPLAAASGVLDLSEPGDRLEREADEAAERVVRRLAVAPGGASGDAAPPHPPEPPPAYARGLVVQRASLVEVVAESAGLVPRRDSPGGLIVDDRAETLSPGQMKKTPFLAQLREVACETAERELRRAGRSARDCPYIDEILGRFARRAPDQLERSIRRYAPEARTATRARDYLPPVATRLGQGVATWVRTGRMPDNLPDEFRPGRLSDLLETGASLGRAARALFKGRDGAAGRAGVDAGALAGQLGPGRPLDGTARTRMESAFGHPFGDVRIHVDDRAAALSRELEARAFTLGTHVAFGAGEFRPSTPAGDALLAHELAHVVQQRGGRPSGELAVSDANDALERDADRAAAGAVASLHGRASLRRGSLLTGGLRLQRCPSGPAPVARRVLRSETTPFGTYSIISDGVPDRERQQNDLTESELTRLQGVWTHITAGTGGLVIHGTTTDKTDFIALLAREMPRSRVFRSIVTEIVEDPAHPVTVNAGRDNAPWGDSFATNALDLRDLEWFEDVAPAGAAWAQTRGEVLVHILVERRHAATTGSGFDPAHARPLAAGGEQERYRRDRGQTGRVTSQTGVTTAPGLREGHYTDTAGNVTIIRRDHSNPAPVPYEAEYRAAGLAAGTAGVMRHNDMVARVTSTNPTAENLFVQFRGATSHVDTAVGAVSAATAQRLAVPLRGIVPVGGPITARLYRRNASGPDTLLATIVWPHPFTSTTGAATAGGVDYGVTLELVRR